MALDDDTFHVSILNVCGRRDDNDVNYDNVNGPTRNRFPVSSVEKPWSTYFSITKLNLDFGKVFRDKILVFRMFLPLVRPVFLKE